MQRTQRVILNIPEAGLEQFDASLEVARTMRPGLSRAAAIREGMLLWQVSVIPAMLATHGRADEVAKVLADIERAGVDKVTGEYKPSLAAALGAASLKLKAERDEG